VNADPVAAVRAVQDAAGLNANSLLRALYTKPAVCLTRLVMTPFSQLIRSITKTGSHHSVNAPDDWRQGRTLYGGISAALCLEAVLRDFSDLPPLRSAQIAFVGPATAEAQMHTQLLRQGKSASFIACDLMSDGQVATRALFCFGGERTIAPLIDAPSMPADLPPPDQCSDFFGGPFGPVFTQHFDMRRAKGPMPLSGADAADVYLWARHKDEAATRGAVALLALADAAPPAAIALPTSIKAISSMTWTLDFVAPQLCDQGDWWLCQSLAENNAHGYSAQSMAIWSETGEAVVRGRQTIAIFPVG
jgi:acyl-CoA thioesterase